MVEVRVSNVGANCAGQCVLCIALEWNGFVPRVSVC